MFTSSFLPFTNNWCWLLHRLSRGLWRRYFRNRVRWWRICFSPSLFLLLMRFGVSKTRMDPELSMQGLDRRLGSFLLMVIFLNVINLFWRFPFKLCSFSDWSRNIFTLINLKNLLRLSSINWRRSKTVIRQIVGSSLPSLFSQGYSSDIRSWFHLTFFILYIFNIISSLTR